MSQSASRPRGPLVRTRGLLSLMVAAALGALVAACGGDGTQSAAPQPSGGCDNCGTALVTMTDAPGDFISYTIDVSSLQLQKADGTLVQTLPATARIDFAQLVDLSEVLSAGQIPAGEYVAATLRADFTNADIVVENDSGTGVDVTAVDAAGQPLGAVELVVRLDNRNRLRITAGRISHLAFDLNLAASNTVDLTAGRVTVSPFVVAGVVPPEPFDTRARGRLASVDVSGSSYTVDLRPFHATSNALGQVTVHTTGTTTFEINGTVAIGAAGLSQLATLTDRPMVIAFGTLDATDHRFTARRVLAGSSVDDERRDYVSGNVLARSGDTLTVGRAHVKRRDGHLAHEHRPVTLTVGAATRVTRAGQGAGTFDIGDISVGQRIEALGDLSRATGGAASLDATAGSVRLDYTQVFGTVTAAAAQGLTLSLRSIDGRNADDFDFTGTGATAADDTDPDSYEVDVAALPVPGLVAGAYTRLRGFVTPFGAAPADFTAETALDFASTRAALGASWGANGTAAPFTAVSSAGLVLNLAGAAPAHAGITVGGRIVALPAAGLTVVPASGATLSLAIAHRSARRIDNFSDFGEFTTELNGRLNGTTTLLKLVAYGTFDAPGGQFAARQLLVVLND